MAATAVGTPRARALSSALREARNASGFGVREVADRLSLSHAQVSNWENGHRVPNVETVALILATIRASRSDRERILDLARNVREPNWLTVGTKGIPQQLAGVVECERAATAITEWAPMLVPGLLQTTNYARSIQSAGGIPEAEKELRVMLSTSRHEVISRRDAARFDALIGEFALRDRIGSNEIMREQLDHLIRISERSNVSVQVVPQRLGWHPGLAGPFVLYSFGNASPVVHFEHHSSGAFIPNQHDVDEYHKAINWIHEIAWNEGDSRSFIRRRVEELEEQHASTPLAQVEPFELER